MNIKKENIAEILEVLDNIKGEYKRPVKLWLWGQAISTWLGIALIGCIAFIIFIIPLLIVIIRALI